MRPYLKISGGYPVPKIAFRDCKYKMKNLFCKIFGGNCHKTGLAPAKNPIFKHNSDLSKAVLGYQK